MSNQAANQPDREVFTVTQLNRAVRATLESNFPLLWVEGEISNLARPASGHIYFSLKDSNAQVRCAMFRMRNQRINFEPEKEQVGQIPTATTKVGGTVRDSEVESRTDGGISRTKVGKDVIGSKITTESIRKAK